MEKKDAKILLVDDSAFMRSVLKNILQAEGYDQFTEAEDGQNAIDQIKTAKPDVVLLDIIMPKIGGMDVLKQVGSEAKIIVISAVGQDQIIEEAKSHGAVGYLVKPFDNIKVIEEVNKVLGV